MATFYGGKAERRSKESKLDDSPYHIFTPEDPSIRDDNPATFSTFQQKQDPTKDSFTDIADSFAAGSPLRCHSTLSTKEKESSSSTLPRHGSQGSNATKGFSPRMAHRNMSIDNITDCGKRIIPPRVQYLSPSISSTPGAMKTLPPRRTHQGSLSNADALFMPHLPRHGSVPNAAEHLSRSMPQQHLMVPGAGRGFTNNQRSDHDVDQPLFGDNLSQEYDRLDPNEVNVGGSSVFHKNAAYESVVRRPYNNSGRNSPLFDIEVERPKDFNNYPREMSNRQIYGSDTNFFEMSSDDGSKTDLSDLQGSDKQRMRKMSSALTLNDYENVIQYVPEATPTTQGTSITQAHSTADKDKSDTEESEKWTTGSPSPQKSILKPDYENLKEYTGTPPTAMTDDGVGQEWIPLAAVSSLVTQFEQQPAEKPAPSPVPSPPLILIHSEDNSSIEDEPRPKEPKQQSGPDTSLGRGLHKSIETISDYEEMVSSFSSQCYTAIASTQQQSFPFLSSLELAGATTEPKQQEDDDKHDAHGAGPTGDTQQSTAISPRPTSDKQPPAPKRNRANCCFQYCLILITLVIAIAALALSIWNFLRPDSNNEGSGNGTPTPTPTP